MASVPPDKHIDRGWQRGRQFSFSGRNEIATFYISDTTLFSSEAMQGKASVVADKRLPNH
jgi:hypothetical protein